MFSGGKKADCPLWKAPCKEHDCRWYINIIGKHPQTGADINQWDCAIALLPMLLIENAMTQRQTAASIQSFRNEVVDQHNHLLHMNEQTLRLESKT